MASKSEVEMPALLLSELREVVVLHSAAVNVLFIEKAIPTR